MTDVNSFMDRFHSAFAKRNLEALATQMSDDIEYLAPGLTLQGKAARIQAEQATLDAVTDAVITVERRIIAGNTVIEECLISGTQTGPLRTPEGELPASGKHFSLRYMQLLDIEDDHVVRQHIFWDRLDLMTQLSA